MYRQGDLLFLPSKIIKGKKQKNNIIALGELTGHSHELVKGDVYKANGEKYLSLAEPSEVVHQEHNPVKLPAGQYLVTRQREYKPVKQISRLVND